MFQAFMEQHALDLKALFADDFDDEPPAAVDPALSTNGDQVPADAAAATAPAPLPSILWFNDTSGLDPDDTTASASVAVALEAVNDASPDVDDSVVDAGEAAANAPLLDLATKTPPAVDAAPSIQPHVKTNGAAPLPALADDEAPDAAAGLDDAAETVAAIAAETATPADDTSVPPTARAIDTPPSAVGNDTPVDAVERQIDPVANLLANAPLTHGADDEASKPAKDGSSETTTEARSQRRASKTDDEGDVDQATLAALLLPMSVAMPTDTSAAIASDATAEKSSSASSDAAAADAVSSSESGATTAAAPCAPDATVPAAPAATSGAAATGQPLASDVEADAAKSFRPDITALAAPKANASATGPQPDAVSGKSAVPDAPSASDALNPTTAPEAAASVSGALPPHDSPVSAGTSLGKPPGAAREATKGVIESAALPLPTAAASEVAVPVVAEESASRPRFDASTPTPQAAAALRLAGEEPVTPLAAEVAALAAAMPAGAPASSGQPSSDDRQEHSRGRSAEPVSAVAQRLAQTVQLMAGFDRALEVAAPKAASGETPALPNEPQVMASIVKSMHLQYQNGVGTAVVKLDPEFLGGVTVSLQLSRGGAISASLQADRADVRAWLEANQHTLREALGQQGLSLDRLVVSDQESAPRDATADGRRKPPQKQAPRSSRKAPSNESVTFEVVV